MLLTILLVALAVPSTASAGDSCNGYSNVAGIQSNGTGSGCTVTTSSGSLPFTGLDLGIVLAAGVLLLGAGLTLRRFSSKRQDA